MFHLSETLPKNPVVYVTRDIERALAFVHQKSYFIITNASGFAKSLAKKNQNLILVSRPTPADTHELLKTSETREFINSLKEPSILVFKNTPQIEKTCNDNGWKLLNPSAELASKIEEKISQVAWLGELSDMLPPHKIMNGAELDWSGKNYIIQFNRAHTGSGTQLVASESEVSAIKLKFPERPLRVTDFISGPVFTSNNVVVGNKVLNGPIMYQITGLSPFTGNPFATIGNDWELPSKILSNEQVKSFLDIANEVGKKLIVSGWKGLFGIDVIMDEKSGKLFLLEINARQPASTTYESELQGNVLTTFGAHLSALLGKDHEPISPVTEGAQIILRCPKNGIFDLSELENELTKLGLKTIPYEASGPEKDLLRIQSKKGIMYAHNQLNELGLTIKKVVEKYV
jgi:hypothetical protein